MNTGFQSLRMPAAAAVAGLLLALWVGGRDRWEPGPDARPVDRAPRLSPDNAGTTLPPNICPLNLRVLEPGISYHARLEGRSGRRLTVSCGDGGIRFPPAAWRDLLVENRGRELTLLVSVREQGGRSKTFLPVVWHVAAEEVDPILVYRFIWPHFNMWNDIRICQRRLESFETSEILRGRQFGDGCTNCHSFSNNSPRSMSIAVRGAGLGAHPNASLVVKDRVVRRFNTPWGYTSWHPDGRHAAYSLNNVRQFFHGAGGPVADVFDIDSDVVLCDTETGRVFTSPELSDPGRLETYPSWSPDGRMLYFCSAPILWKDRNRQVPKEYSAVRYDLCRVRVDLGQERIGKVETVFKASDAGGSVLLPRVSPDGRWLVCCVCDYGCFPIYRPSSDLFLLDLRTGSRRRMDEWSSPESDSYHSWSSNGRWCAFSSKRLTGVFTRTYLAHFDADGRGAKPFVLPQENPDFYESCTRTFTVPELLREPVPVSARVLGSVARSPDGVSIAPAPSLSRSSPADPAPAEGP